MWLRDRGGDGTEVVEKALSEEPDLILMDLGLPDITGMDAAKALKGNPSTAHIPIVAHTAWTVSQWKEAALEAEMVDYLEKPVSREALKETIARFIPD